MEHTPAAAGIMAALRVPGPLHDGSRRKNEGRSYFGTSLPQGHATAPCAFGSKDRESSQIWHNGTAQAKCVGEILVGSIAARSGREVSLLMPFLCCRLVNLFVNGFLQCNSAGVKKTWTNEATRHALQV